MSQKHPVTSEVESDPDSLNQMRQQNVGRGTFLEIGVHRGTVYRVAARRMPAVCPVDQTIL